MSILIKMDMPKSCGYCPLMDTAGYGMHYTYHYCKMTGEHVSYESKQDNCPIIELPPHGRLIEESKVLDIVSEWCPDDDGSVGKDGDLREMLDEIEAIPTIIEAEANDETL